MVNIIILINNSYLTNIIVMLFPIMHSSFSGIYILLIKNILEAWKMKYCFSFHNNNLYEKIAGPKCLFLT